jgi:hypothetical protein
MKALPKNTHTGRGGSEEGRSALTQRERGGCEEEPVHNPGELARFSSFKVLDESFNFPRLAKQKSARWFRGRTIKKRSSLRPRW